MDPANPRVKEFDDVKSQVDDFKSDLAQVRSDLKALAEDLAGLGKSSAGEARETVTASAEKWLEKARETVAESPIKVVAGAFAIGYLLAKIRG